MWLCFCFVIFGMFFEYFIRVNRFRFHKIPAVPNYFSNLHEILLFRSFYQPIQSGFHKFKCNWETFTEWDNWELLLISIGDKCKFVFLLLFVYLIRWKLNARDNYIGCKMRSMGNWWTPVWYLDSMVHVLVLYMLLLKDNNFLLF